MTLTERPDQALRPQLPEPVAVAGTALHPVTRAQALEAVLDFAAAGVPGLVVTPNVDHVVLLGQDERLREAYASARLQLCDGHPLLLLSRLCGRPVPERVTGADLFDDVCAAAAGRGLRVFVAGGAPEVLERGLAALRERHPDLDIRGHSPARGFEGTAADDELQAVLAAARPDVVAVCLGAPRAEIWAAAQVHRYSAVYLCVGAAIDFAAGARRRAPRWLQRLGLEWLFRLAQEPGRLWRRYLLRDPAFLGIAARELLRGARRGTTGLSN